MDVVFMLEVQVVDQEDADEVKDMLEFVLAEELSKMTVVNEDGESNTYKY